LRKEDATTTGPTATEVSNSKPLDVSTSQPALTETILELYSAHEEDGERSKVVPAEEFGFRKVRIQQPLRLNFQASDERIARLDDERGFQNLVKTRKREPETKRKEVETGRKLQGHIRGMLGSMPGTLFNDRRDFRTALNTAAKDAGHKLPAPVLKAIESALSEQDETAEICWDSKGNPESDADLRDYENVPLDEDVSAYFDREVKPYVPDAWIDVSYIDARDGRVGRVGYEINFNRYFYVYEPPRPLEKIEADIREIEKEILGMLGEVGA
jgi:type I restriction enzyme M protein